MSAVKASYLVENFKFMANNKWKYVANAASYGSVDCSGAFSYWYRQAGGYMYHGSNTMWRKYSTEKGKIGEIELVPGMAVYKRRVDGKEPSAYRNDGQGNFFHVGLYIGDGKVVEAKGTRYGVVYSKISEWTHCSKLKNTTYDLNTNSSVITIVEKEITYPTKGRVSTSGGKLNMRTLPSTNGSRIFQIPNKTELTILGKSNTWYQIEYNGKTGYVSSTYISLL